MITTKSQMTAKEAVAVLSKLKKCKEEIVGEQLVQMGIAIQTLVQATGSIVPALGYLIQIKGQPFTQDLPVMLETLFDLKLPRRSILKCGRQIGKSSSQAARTIILSASIPNFQTLTVTPQFELTRRYSSNYIRPLLEKSVIGGMVLDSDCERNVLQRTLVNGSMMHFSFALLDADRVRGIPADRVHIDESITPCWITTYNKYCGAQYTWLTDLTPGTIILSFDSENRVVADKLVRLSDHGTRPCFRITTEEGHAIELTAESWVATDKGWQRLSQIVSEISRRAVYGGEANAANSTVNSECDTGAIGAGLDVRRQLHELQQACEVQKPAWVGADGVQLDQVPDIVRVRSLDAHKEEEQRVREMVERLPDNITSSIRLLVSDMLPPSSQTRERKMAAGDRQCGSVGISGVVGSRRRESVAAVNHPTYRRVLTARSNTAPRLAVQPPWGESAYQGGEETRAVQEIQRVVSYNDGYCKADILDTTPYTCVYAVQARAEGTTDARSVHVLRQAIQVNKRGAEEPAKQMAVMLQESRMPNNTAQAHKSTQCSTPGCQRPQENPCERGVLLQSGRVTEEESRTPSRVYVKTQNGVQRASKDKSCVSSRAEKNTQLVMPALWVNGATGIEGLEVEILPNMPVHRNHGDQETLRAVRIAKIEYIGEQHVYDLETERNHTFIANGIAVHNCQDVDYQFIDEIMQTMGRSKWRLQDYTGTPKTLDGTIETLWSASSKAEWLVPCSCGYTNNPCVEADGLRMIGDTGVVCSKCTGKVNPAEGYWYHMSPEKQHDFVGWHLPQFILPFHYNDTKNWRIILHAKNGGVSKRILYNEILGESCDVGAKLVTEADLRTAARLPVPMSIEKAIKLARGYSFVCLAVDWGGRGEDETSKTKLAVLGMRPSGHVDLLYGEDLSLCIDAGAEVARVLELFYKFNCKVLAHDAAGTAGTRDVLLNHAHFPRRNVMPMAYVSAWSKDVITFHEANEQIKWPHYSIDKTRSLLLTVACVKSEYLSFPTYDSCADLLSDFTALVEEKSDSARGSDVYLVRKAKGRSDDFAQAINYGLMATFYVNNKFPDLVNTIKAFSPEYLKSLEEEARDRSKEEWLK